jgi:crotonobetainyl-CoA:carnitine CoA-transferase CaiB-like acyl-CoA transferase
MSGSTEAMARRIFTVIGRADMIADGRFSSNAARVRHRGLVDEAVGGWFAARPREEALQTMREAGVTVGPVYTIADAIADGHFLERGILVDVEDAELGAVPMHNIVPRLSQSTGAWRRPSPRLGEHTDVVLAEAGFDGEAIARLKEEGVL